MTLSQWRKFSFRIYFSYIILFYAILIFGIEPINIYSKTFGIIGNIMCFPVFWQGIKAQNTSERKPWHYFMASAVVYLIGEIIYAYFTDFVGEEPESPSICDIFYFGNAVVCYIGLIYYIKLIQKNDLRSISFDMLISVFAAAGIIYNFVMLPLISNGLPSDLFVIIANLYNPVFDFALLTGLLLFFFGSDIRKLFLPANILLGIAFTFSFAIDQFFLINSLYDLNVDLVLDPLWSLYYMLIAFASLYPETESNLESKGSTHHLDSFLEYFRILLPYIVTFIILLMIGI